MATDFNQEIHAAFDKFCVDKQTPTISDESVGYIRHALKKSVAFAAQRGEEVDVSHHPLFASMALKSGDGQIVVEFLMSLPKEQVDRRSI